MEKQANWLLLTEATVNQSSHGNQNMSSGRVDCDYSIYNRILSGNKFPAINLGRLGTILNILTSTLCKESDPILILSVFSTHGCLSPIQVSVYNAASMIVNQCNFQIYFECFICKTKITSNDLLFSRFISELVNATKYTENILEKLKCYHSDYCKANHYKLNLEDFNFSLEEGIHSRDSSNSTIKCMLLTVLMLTIYYMLVKPYLNPE